MAVITVKSAKKTSKYILIGPDKLPSLLRNAPPVSYRDFRETGPCTRTGQWRAGWSQERISLSVIKRKQGDMEESQVRGLGYVNLTWFILDIVKTKVGFPGRPQTVSVTSREVIEACVLAGFEYSVWPS